MGMAPLHGDPARAFDVLAGAAARIRAEHPAATTISAGMSGDLAEAIAAGHGVRALVGAAASVHSVLEGLAGADLAHLATHGWLRPDNPQFSELTLADGAMLVHHLDTVGRLRAQLDPERSVIDNVVEGSDFIEINGQRKHALSYLQDFLFSPQRARTPVKALSGGERNRLLLAKLFTRPTNLLILDEPTTGLHFADIEKLLEVLQRLADAGNTVLVIEHNLDVIKCSDWVIDLGPEGGAGGGELLAQGTPEEVAEVKGSFTGKYLKHVLEKGRKQRVGTRVAG